MGININPSSANSIAKAAGSVIGAFYTAFFENGTGDKFIVMLVAYAALGYMVGNLVSSAIDIASAGKRKSETSGQGM
ncbi:MAG: hypothetical protein MR051_03430 [Lentisphaeria bacterium]|nr:hypothetical protein [Lentisphaeria bacterium]